MGWERSQVWTVLVVRSVSFCSPTSTPRPGLWETRVIAFSTAMGFLRMGAATNGGPFRTAAPSFVILITTAGCPEAPSRVVKDLKYGLVGYSSG